MISRTSVLLAWLMLGAVSPADADDVRSSGPLALAAPRDLVAGRDASAVISLAAGEPVTLVATAGVVDAPVAAGDGRLHARWTMPATRFPQVAIVAALGADGRVRDWIAVPLAGNATVKVDTRAGSMVTLRVGGREFGPVAANRSGVAAVPVIVPPGITSATAIALDRAGRRGESTVDLAVPEFQRVLSVCGPAGDRVELLAVGPTGVPASEPPAVTISGASAGAATRISPGWFAVPVDSTRATVDDADVTAVADGEVATASTCRLRLPPERPTGIHVEPDRTSVVAGSGDVVLRVVVEYPGLRRPAPVRVLATTDLGRVALDPEHEPTRWQGRWSLPAELGGRTTARATIVGVAGDSRVEAAAAVTLAPDEVHAIEVEARGPLRADGLARTRVIARVRDRHGNLVSSDGLSADATGTLGRFERAADGSLVATYVAPRSRSLRRDAIVVTDRRTRVTAQTEIQLEPLGPARRADLRLGWFDNLGRVSAPVMTLEASAAVPVPRIAVDRVRAGVGVGAYRAGFRAMVDGEEVDVSVTTVPIAGRLSYARRLGPAELLAGVGFGAAVVDAATTSPSAGRRARTLVRPIYIAAVQGRYPRGRIALVGGVEYWRARGDTGDVHGSLGGIVTTVGVGAPF